MRSRVYLILGVVGVLSSAFLAACSKDKAGSGVEKSEKRTVGEFSSIEVEGAGEVHLIGGPSTAVSVRTDHNLVGLVKTTAENGRLKVVFPMDVKTDLGLHVTIQAPKVSAAHLVGAIEMTATGLSGDGFELTSKGAGSMTLSGTVGTLKIDAQGAAKVDAAGLKSQKAVLRLKGAGSIDIHAEKSLDADVQGAGKISYSGSPEVTQKVSGVGSISRR